MPPDEAGDTSLITKANTATWMFRRAAECVHISRLTLPSGCFLLVEGPGYRWRIDECGDLMGSVVHQSELERWLIARGYRLEAFLSRHTDPQG